MENSVKDLKQKLENAQGFIFDLDGTLVNLEELNFSAYKVMMRRVFKRDLGRDLYDRLFVGTRTMDAVAWLIDDLGVRGITVEEAAQVFWDAKWEILEKDDGRNHIDVKFGAHELLGLLKKRELPLCLATSSTSRSTELILPAVDMKKYFDHILTADDVERGKPEPEMYEKALVHLDMPSSATIVFEDSESGIQSAKNAGIYCIGVRNGDWNREFVARSDIVIDDFMVCVDLLK